MTDADKLNAMIAASSVGLKKPTVDSWFTYGHQKQYIFALAAKLYIEFDYEAEEAIKKAEEFIDIFYKRKMEKK